MSVPTRSLVFTLGVLLFCAPNLYSQSAFVNALITRKVGELARAFPARTANEIHRQLIVDTLAAAQPLNVHFEPEAARELDKIFARISDIVLKEPEGSERLQTFEDNRRRFIAGMISIGETRPGRSIWITKETVARLKLEMEKKLSSFCPCWPFCEKIG